jgi:uncharacterized RmlC-like cupin family protein
MSFGSNDTGHYEGVLLEEINDRLKALLEGQDTLAKATAVAQLQADTTEVKADIKTVQAAIKAQSAASTDHERRITRLETRITT